MTSPSASVDSPVGSLSAELGALVDDFVAGVNERIGRLAPAGTNRELIEAVQAVERAVRAAEQAESTVLEHVDSRGVYHLDGHTDAKAWLRSSVQCAPSDVARRHRLGRFGRYVPQAAQALATGEVSVAHVNKLALAWGNPRVRDELERTIDVWLCVARFLDFDTFGAHLDEWVRLNDADGGHRERDEAHRSRDFRFLTVGATTLLRGQLGAVQAEIVEQVFQAYVDAEYRFDVDEARSRTDVEQVGEQVLRRTPAQRRADAFMKLVEAAASAPLDGSPVSVTVDIVIDQQTFEEQLLDMLDPLHRHRTTPTGPKPPCGIGPVVDSAASIAVDDAADVPGHDADGLVTSMCHSRRGSPVDPADAVVAALVGHVRRVVLGARGVVIDQGARRTLFTGSARDAALLQAAVDGQYRCLWPACGRHIRQIDHTTPRSEGGATRPDNAGPMCGRHNVFKTSGYRTRRDAHGYWHVYRADGTEIRPT